MMTIASPIIVTGARRSGLSITAACLHSLGVDSGDRDVAVLAKAIFENRRILNNLIDPLLMLTGIPVNGSKPFATRDMNGHLGEFVGILGRRVLMIQELAKVDCSRPWLLKSHKMAMIWKHWAAAFPGTRWILVRRERKDLVRSCMGTSYMDFHNTSEQWTGWAREWEELLDEMQEVLGPERCRIFHPLGWTQGDYSELEEICSWLGLKYDEKLIPRPNGKKGGF